MTPEQARKIYDNLLSLRKLISDSHRVAMNLFCHPDATANQVMATQQMLVNSRMEYQRMLGQFKKVLPIAAERVLGYGRSLDKLKL